jgi:hypothetical protein
LKRKNKLEETMTAYAFLVIDFPLRRLFQLGRHDSYQTSEEGELQQVAYEKQLKRISIYSGKIAKSKADLFPMERDAYFEAQVEMVNKTMND